MRWWCSNDGSNWSWTWKPYIGAWAIVAAVAVWLWRSGAFRSEVPARRKISLALGLVLILGGTDWPLSTLGAGYVVSAQMVRQVLIVMIACPLVLYGAPESLGRWLEATPRRRAVLRIATQPLLALVVSVSLLFAVSAPILVDPLVTSQLGSFALDLAWISAGFLIWMPVQPPSPMVPRLRGPVAIVYLIGVSVAPLPVAFFMTWSPTPIYSVYELAPRVWDTFDAQSDQELAAAIFQVAGGLVIWAQIAVRFVRMAGGGGGSAAGPKFRGTLVGATPATDG
ncbi:MAG: cytochrome c oxidase assembly protein [Microthrixaceae bacterium]